MQMYEDTLSVLLLSGQFQLRGSSAQTLNLVELLPSQNIETQIVCLDAHLMEPWRRKELGIIEVTQLALPFIGQTLSRSLLKQLFDHPPDIIHIQSRRMLRLGDRLASQLQRPYVVTVHDYLSPREAFRFNSQWGRKVIAVSDSVKSELLKRTRLTDDLVTVIHSGVSMMVPVEDEPLPKNHVPVVGTAGPLEVEKGLDIFLRAIPQVLEQVSPVEFLISGAGPEEANLRRLSRDLKIASHVTFVPNVFDVGEALNAVDVFCLPSLKQGLGTIMLEAMARSKPVIATPVGGVYGVIADGETGLFVEPSDSADLAGKIIRLLSDRAFAEQLGQAGQHRVRTHYAIDEMVNRTADVYRSIVGPRPDAARSSAS